MAYSSVRAPFETFQLNERLHGWPEGWTSIWASPGIELGLRTESARQRSQRSRCGVLPPALDSDALVAMHATFRQGLV